MFAFQPAFGAGRKTEKPKTNPQHTVVIKRDPLPVPVSRPTPAPPPAVTVPAPPAGLKTHPVWIWQETRDCLWNIAAEVYGDPFLWPRLYEANRHLIKDPSVIFPKQEIAIPPLEEVRSSAPLTPVRPPERKVSGPEEDIVEVWVERLDKLIPASAAKVSSVPPEPKGDVVDEHRWP